jgi:hypothetical protein
MAGDARAVAGTVTAAGRRLRPDPQLLAHDGAQALPSAVATATPAGAPPTLTGSAGTDTAVVVGTRGTDDPVARTASPDATARMAAAHAADRASDGNASVPGVAAVAVAERDLAAPLPAPAPAHVGGGGAPAQRRRRPLPARARQPDRPGGVAARSAAVPAAAPTPAAAAPHRPRRRDGVVVPLRVPWTARLRATAGLVVMVACLGSATAVVIAVLAVIAVRSLGQF